MSAMTAALSSRLLAPATLETATETVALSDLPVGASAVITKVCDRMDPDTARRLFDLGFVPGAPVQKLRRSPFGDPSIYRIADYDIALRRSQVRCITVDRTS